MTNSRASSSGSSWSEAVDREVVMTGLTPASCIFVNRPQNSGRIATGLDNPSCRWISPSTPGIVWAAADDEGIPEGSRSLVGETDEPVQLGAVTADVAGGIDVHVSHVDGL